MAELSGILYLDAEKIQDKGEDSLTYRFGTDGNGYMFVFDGCGGAGSEKHSGLDGHKSAYVASRSCAMLLDKLCSESLEFPDNPEKTFFSFLKKINEVYPMETSRSTLVDILPTTISGTFIRNDGDFLDIDFIWAGDSRGYIIDADGLGQVTEDDVVSEDAYRNLFDDSVMTNRLHGNPDKELFTIHSAKVRHNGKCIIICATDGCYDYFNSPMVFEFFLITMMFTSGSFTESERKLLEILNEKSGDDCSLIAVFYGFNDYQEIRDFLRERFIALDGDKHIFSESYWNDSYKKNYYRFNQARSETSGNN